MIRRQRIRHGGTEQWLYFAASSTEPDGQDIHVVELNELSAQTREALVQSPVVILTDLVVEIDGDDFEHLRRVASSIKARAWTSNEMSSGGRDRAIWKPESSPIRLLNDPYVGGVLGVSGELFDRLLQDLPASPLSREGLSPVLAASLWLWDQGVAIRKLSGVTLRRSEEPGKVPLHRWHGAISRLLALRGIEHRRVNRFEEPRIELLASNPGDVSLIIPTNGSSRRVWGAEEPLVVRCVESVFSQTRHQDLEVIVVYDSQTPSGVLSALASMGDSRLRLIEFERPFNFSEKCNLGALRANANTLCFLNDDTLIRSHDWIESSLGYLQRPGVGLVGPRLLLEDSRIQSAGHVIDDEGVVHLSAGESSLTPITPAARLSGERIGVTFACAFASSETFRRVGGLCEDLPNSFNDVDFGFKLQVAGFSSVWNADSDVIHFESLTRNPRPRAHETEFVGSRWGHLLTGEDPYIEPLTAAVR